MKNLNKKRKGFTLMEIIIVVIIIGILAAIIVPKFSDSTITAKKTADIAEHRTAVGQVTMAMAAVTGDLTMDAVLKKLEDDKVIDAVATGKFGKQTVISKGTKSVKVTTTLRAGTLEGDEKVTGGSDADGGSDDGDTTKVTYIYVGK